MEPTTPDGKYWGVDPKEAWHVEPKPVPDALTDTFTPAPFNGVDAGRDWVSLAEKLDAGGMALLMAYGAIGEPHE